VPRTRGIVRSWRLVVVAVGMGVVVTIALAAAGIYLGPRVKITPVAFEDPAAAVAWHLRSSLLFERIIWSTTLWSEGLAGPHVDPNKIVVISRALPRWSLRRAHGGGPASGAMTGDEVAVGFPFRCLTGHLLIIKHVNLVKIGYIEWRPNTQTYQVPTDVHLGRFLADTSVMALSAYVPLEILARILARRRMYQGRCGRCKYDLSGVADGVCPECGKPMPGAGERITA